MLVPNQVAPPQLDLTARAWPAGAYIAGPSYTAGIAGVLQPPASRPAAATAADAPPADGFGAVSEPQQQLLLAFREPVCLGQAGSASFEVGNVKGSGGASILECTIADIPAAAKAAGWAVDMGPSTAGKPLAVPAGEKRTVAVRFSPPAEPAADSALLLGLSEWAEVQLAVTIKGGVPACGSSDGLARYCVTARCLVVPAAGAPAAAAAAK